MLVISRHRDESIVIGDDIVITVVDIRGDKVRLGIVAPIEVPVDRTEVREVKDRERNGGARMSKRPDWIYGSLGCTDEAKRRANLAAAAPDLFEACEEAESILGDVVTNKSNQATERDAAALVLTLVRAALAKSRGGGT